MRDNAIQNKTRQDNTISDNLRQHKTICPMQDYVIQCKTGRDNNTPYERQCNTTQ